MRARAYVLAPGAVADIQEIARYSQAQWGEARRRAYIAALEAQTEAMAQGRGAFKHLDGWMPGLRVATSGRHHIFCVVRPSQPALVLAVLHERMDLFARLQGRMDV